MVSWVPAKGGHEGRPYGDVGGRWQAGVPTAGDKPQRYNPLSPPLWIPGHAFIAIAHSGCGRHTEV